MVASLQLTGPHSSALVSAGGASPSRSPPQGGLRPHEGASSLVVSVASFGGRGHSPRTPSGPSTPRYAREGPSYHLATLGSEVALRAMLQVASLPIPSGLFAHNTSFSANRHLILRWLIARRRCCFAHCLLSVAPLPCPFVHSSFLGMASVQGSVAPSGPFGPTGLRPVAC